MAILQPRPAILRRLARTRWVDLEPLVREDEAPLAPSSRLDHAQARVWSAVLAAARVPYKLSHSGRMVRVLVPSWAAAFAVEEVRRWLAENSSEQAALPPSPETPVASFWPTLLIMLGLVAFHFFVRMPHSRPGLVPDGWIEAGTASVEYIFDGQWWRLVTALTLHADVPHVLGNAVFGGLFAGLLCRRVGSGVGWLLILVAGMAGNGFNAFVAASSHASLGFSTSLFGAAGALAGLHLYPRGLRRGGLSRTFAPLAAALGILAMLGTGGDDVGTVDLGAHLFGLAAGLALGIGTGWMMHCRGLPGRAVNALSGLLAFGMVAGAWWIALE